MFNFKFTAPITFVIHAFVGLLAGAVISFLTVAGQAAFQNNVSPQLAISTGLTAFLVSFAHSWYALRNSPQFGQAERDALAQGQTRLTTIENSHAGLLDSFNSLYQQYQQSANAKPVAASQAQPQASLQGAYNLATQSFSPSLQGTAQQAFTASSAVPLSASGVPLRYGDTGLTAVPPRG